jgi:hypothetical protein
MLLLLLLLLLVCTVAAVQTVIHVDVSQCFTLLLQYSVI